MARGLAQALVSLHAAGVVHRDLKPSNVLLGPNGPKVIDFGIAHLPDATALTATGLVIGTPGYLAPEQILTEAEPASDIFSWACTVAHAATGRPPFGTGPASAVLYRVVHEAPDLAGITQPLSRILLPAFSKDPAGRPRPPT
ncbi:serine/threonine-protein kinase [Streptacidiphilus monticola]